MVCKSQCIPTDRVSSPPETAQIANLDRCLCNSTHIRNGAKLLALLDWAALLLLLILSIWEYTHLKSTRATPILDKIFITIVLSCIFVGSIAALFLIDVISDRPSARPFLIELYLMRRSISVILPPTSLLICLIELYLMRRSISVILPPTSLLICLIGLITSPNESWVRRVIGNMAEEMLPADQFAIHHKTYVDYILGCLLTVCVLSTPFDAWAWLITFQYYQYRRKNGTTGENVEMQMGRIKNEMGTEMSAGSETDSTEASDVCLETRPDC